VDQFETPSEGQLEKTGEVYITGEIEDHVIVSVPITMSHSSATSLVEELNKAIKKPVILVSHNVHFMRTTKLSFKDVRGVLGRLKGEVDAESESNAREAGEELGSGQEVDGDGAGSGIRDGGSGDLDPGEDWGEAGGSGAEGVPDEEGQQEAEDSPPGSE
jgi:hypothetical protein